MSEEKQDAQEKTEEKTSDDEVEIKEKEVKPPRKPQTKQIKKNGELRKEISEEQQAKRLEILKAGREKALKMRQEKKALMEAEKNKPKSEPEPEPEKKYKVVKPKKKKKIIIEESSSSSEEEVVVRRKKRTSTPAPPPAPAPALAPTPPPNPAPTPARPQLSDLEKRKEVLRLQRELAEKRFVNSIFF